MPASKGYRFGVEWIGLNDNAGNSDNESEIAGYISTALLADLFSKDTAEVARDIVNFRKRQRRFRIHWHNNHATGAVPGEYTSKRAAEKAARQWKREMVAMELSAKDRRDARNEYQWEVIEI